MGLLRRLRATPEDRFASEVLDAVRASGAVAKAWYAPEQFAIGWRRSPHDNDGWIYLSNTFRETAGMDRRERGDIIRRLVATMVSAGPEDLTWDEVRPRLRPVLRGITFGLGVPDGAMPPLARPAMPYLAEMVVIDLPDSMAYVTAARLDDWGVVASDVFDAARENLADLADRATAADADHGATMVRFIDDGDTYCTSMLLVDGFLARMCERTGGRAVAFVPDRNSMLVVPDDANALLTLLPMVEEEYVESVRSVSPVAYTVDDAGAVIPYPVEGSGPLAARLHRAEAILAATEYAAQKDMLDARHDKAGVDVFVGSLIAGARQDESLFTVAVWTDGIDTLLPEADFVGFVADGSAPGADMFTVPWLAVANEMDLVPADGLHPTRYRVTAWPAPEVIDRLRARAVEP
jgi:hypothetical protein